ncbi:NRDE family protein [Ammoniphilus sp. CFH 90114]|uniref:NRDE family protein n=1 Tax=Ammoniphilus sp. CFH 90114 TaxID=2493665 RepID=UPI00100F706D|nr:NRDE family protein [Ammoniphilus sp. CFH 90114]RXT07113.1 NRDE family protein [Ammoniphilus sp. CFH 90114]
MCIILFSYQNHPQYRFVVAANRDEYYQRPTAPASFWEDYPFFLAGRDLEKMGTWMGITKTGRFAAITNYRDPSVLLADARSRGELVSDYLIGHDSPDAYLKKVKNNSRSYQGFNLLVGDLEHLWYYSWLSNSIDEVTPGIHGLSNAELNTTWPKVEKGKQLLHSCLQKPTLNKDCLFEVLADEKQVKDESLPDTGVGIEWERILSPVFIASANYGTRSSTLMTIDYENRVTYTERTFLSSKEKAEEVSFTFATQT